MAEDTGATLVAGTINATGKTLYWKDELELLNIGDYAIVENMHGYDLIKVIGIIETTEQNANKFSNTKYENMKRILIKIAKCNLED